MQRLLKPYVYTIAILSLYFIAYFIFKQPLYFNLEIAVFMLITICLQYNDSLVSEDISMSLTSGSCIFMTICFGIYPSIIACASGIILTSAIKYRRQFRVQDLKDMSHQKVVRHEDILIKTLFNVSKEVINGSVIYFLYAALNINFSGQTDMWKVGLISIIENMADMLMVILAASFNSGMWYKGALFNSKTGIFALNNLIISIILTYSYKRIGFISVLLLYMIIFPMQKTTSMYAKIKNQDQELFVDELTGVYNMRFFKDLIGNKIVRGNSFSLLMIDIDNFKFINDTYGHQAGNKVLKDFTRLMKQKILGDNYLCRYGGDEFIIVINDLGEADSMAEQIIGSVSSCAFEYDENHIGIQLSIGIYDHATDDKDDVASAIKKVDKAMYCAKKQGNNIIIDYRDMIEAV